MPPYFIYPDIVALRENADTLSPEQLRRHRRRIAANVSDIPSLRLLLALDPEEFAAFYPDMAPADLSTTATISSFLDRYGRPDAPIPQAALEIPKDTLSPAELIRNHDYQGALERIMELSLNNPEKSVYFADQIRFLRKLILNEQNLN